MKKLLQEFYLWAGKTPEEYNEQGFNQNKGEFEEDFPRFYVLTDKAKQAIDENVTDEDVLRDVLTVMGLDNESENLLEYIEEHSTEEQLSLLIKQGLLHADSNVRWQTALLLSRRKPQGFERELRKLAQDTHAYVRTRAREEINYFAWGDYWEKVLMPNFSRATFLPVTSSLSPCSFCGNRIGENGVTEGYLKQNSSDFVCDTCFCDEYPVFLWRTTDNRIIRANGGYSPYARLETRARLEALRDSVLKGEITFQALSEQFDLPCIQKTWQGYYTAIEQDDRRHIAFVFLREDTTPWYVIITDTFPTKEFFAHRISVGMKKSEVLSADTNTVLLSVGDMDATAHLVQKGVFLVTYERDLNDIQTNEPTVRAIRFIRSENIPWGDNTVRKRIPFLLEEDKMLSK